MARAEHAGSSSAGRLVSVDDYEATKAVLGLVRVSLPCGQQPYERLLAQQLWQLGPGAPQRALEELADPAALEIARFEYSHIWGGVVATLFLLDLEPLPDEALGRIWRTANARRLDTVKALVEEIQLWARSLPAGALDHLRPREGAKNGRRRLRSAIRQGAIIEVERARWYADADERELAKHLQKSMPAHKHSSGPVVSEWSDATAYSKWLNATIRNAFHRDGLLENRPTKQGTAGRMSIPRWRASYLGRWFGPLRADFFAEPREVRARVYDALGRSLRPAPPPPPCPVSSLSEAMERYLPDDVWLQVEPLVRSFAGRSNPRAATLGIAVYAASSAGWGNLPTWLVVSASTCRRWLGRLKSAGVWPAVRRHLVAGPHGAELDGKKIS